MPSLAATTSVSVGNLQFAINAAALGDTLVLAAGSVHPGTITLPNKTTGSGWITIMSSGAIPAAGVRVAPGDLSTMATITGGNGSVPAVDTAATAHHYRFIGIEFKPGTGTQNTGLIRIGSGSETVTSDLPHHIILDRCYVHGDATNGAKRGIAGNGDYVAVIDSYASNFFSTSDAQAFAAWGGQGPFLLRNNYLEASGENVMFGGADTAITNLTPSDITITGNFISKPTSWRGNVDKVMKNIFEIKHARRVLIELNTLENNWVDGQAGMAFNLKSANQDNTNPWAQMEHVTIRYNLTRHCSVGIVLSNQSYEYPALTPAHIYIHHNNFEDVSGVNWGGSGSFVLFGGPVDDVTIANNWADHDGRIIDVDGSPNTRVRVTNNVVRHDGASSSEGVRGSGTATGQATLDTYFPSAIYTGNQMVGGSSYSASYPVGNTYPASMPTEPTIP